MKTCAANILWAKTYVGILILASTDAILALILGILGWIQLLNSDN